MKPDQIAEYERRMVGAALLHPELVDASGLAVEDFGTPWSRQAWQGISRLARHGDPVNELTASETSGLKVSDLTAATDDAVLRARPAGSRSKSGRRQCVADFW